jgi:hypothetical protein
MLAGEHRKHPCHNHICDANWDVRVRRETRWHSVTAVGNRCLRALGVRFVSQRPELAVSQYRCEFRQSTQHQP